MTTRPPSRASSPPDPTWSCSRTCDGRGCGSARSTWSPASPAPARPPAPGPGSSRSRSTTTSPPRRWPPRRSTASPGCGCASPASRSPTSRPPSTWASTRRRPPATAACSRELLTAAGRERADVLLYTPDGARHRARSCRRTGCSTTSWTTSRPSPRRPPGMVLRQRRALEEADVVFAGGRSLHRSVAPLRTGPCHMFASGVETGHYARSLELRRPREQRGRRVRRRHRRAARPRPARRAGRAAAGLDGPRRGAGGEDRRGPRSPRRRTSSTPGWSPTSGCPR